MRAKRRKRLKAKRRRRVHALTTALALITATLAVVFYIFPAIGGTYDSREGTSANHPPRVSACALSDFPSTVIKEVQPARDLEEVVLVTEPAGEADPVELEIHEANLAGAEGDSWSDDLAEVDRQMKSWIMDQVVQQEARRKLVNAINRWLDHRHSPCAGTGELWVQAQERTGVSAALMVAIFDKESTSGTNGALSRKNHNGWGQMGPKLINWYGPYTIPSHNTGYCWWPSWDVAIQGAFDFVRQEWGAAQVATDCFTYCGGDRATWFREVEYVRGRVIEWAQ